MTGFGDDAISIEMLRDAVFFPFAKMSFKHFEKNHAQFDHISFDDWMGGQFVDSSMVVQANVGQLFEGLDFLRG
jgi:hypothetical protein